MRVFNSVDEMAFDNRELWRKKKPKEIIPTVKV